ncbi:CRISPR-associated protein Cas2 [Bacillus sp. FJAT-27225]|uniref:AAA family ATPase n=1 Tax=Bacillus sp. FJAT-27225 TaxID=1743144 RepID=UPI00080C289A|nr:AAA family ATPase [Bacillus sp. FJAT-27225]OCA90450.1 CRISPR-associated protein Cas2 [Bacillus sp. FJAT-27225]
MKRLVIITVGKTHSGKSTFARALEEKLNNSFVMDQDNQAEFINSYYSKLQPEYGPNTLKHSISKLIVDYAIENTHFHIIVSNSNRSRKGRHYLLEEIFNKDQFVRILVHFDIPDIVLQERVSITQRSTTIFRGAYSSFNEVLIRQQAESLHEDISDPVEEEADHLFVIKNNEEIESVIKRIIDISHTY